MAVTAQEINTWLQNNPTASDSQIRSAMDQYGVSTSQFSSATGMNPYEVQARYDAVGTPTTATQAEIMAAYESVLGREADAAGLAYWSDPANGFSLDTFKQAAAPELASRTASSAPGSFGSAYVQPTASANTASMQTLSNWAAPYITDYLSKGQALAGMPYEAYTGPLSAGESGLQSQAFSGLAGLTVPTAFGQAAGAAGTAVQGYQGLGAYDPANITTGQWNQAAAQQYMNPYLMEALNPQLDEARRQAEITRMGDASRLTKAGAYGGSRQAIMESELNRNTLRNLSDITGKGYFDAYNTGMAGFMQDQGRALQAQTAREDSRQFGANYGLAGLAGQLTGAQTLANIGGQQLSAQRNILGDQLAAGETQRGITGEGIKADYEQFREERAWPYQQLQYQKDLMAGLPFSTTSTYGASDPLGAALLGANAGAGLMGLLK
jgi:hypothetical protein